MMEVHFFAPIAGTGNGHICIETTLRVFRNTSNDDEKDQRTIEHTSECSTFHCFSSVIACSVSAKESELDG